jgi:dienelactone hydrolase
MMNLGMASGRAAECNMRSMRRRAGVVVALLAALAVAALAWPHVRGLALVVRATGIEGAPRRLADLLAGPIERRDLIIATDAVELRARAYEPVGRIRRTAVVVPGLHAAGIDEPRFVRMVSELAAAGVAVVTPDIPDLAKFEITPAITSGIEEAARWVSDEPRYAPDGRVGLIGVSFSGGLAVVAAGRPSLAGRVAYVVSMGGHADLPRVLRYVCTGVAPLPRRLLELGGESSLRPPQPHDYGAAMLLLGLVDEVVPAPQAAALRDAVGHFLRASHLDRVDPARAQQEFAALRARAQTLPEPSRTLLGYVNDRDVVHLGARLLPYVAHYGSDPALSPARSPAPSGPVFLQHGISDNVIPAAESVHLTEYLRGKTPVQLLLSGLISHADPAGAPRIADVFEVAGFWGKILQN